MKKYTGITAIIVLMLIAGVTIYFGLTTLTTGSSNPVSPLKPGDSFTYSITGFSTSQSPVVPGFSQYNQTDYYKITITAVSGSLVSYNTFLRYTNVTEKTGTNTIDLSNGQETSAMGFWFVYPPNLKIGDLLIPNWF